MCYTGSVTRKFGQPAPKNRMNTDTPTTNATAPSANGSAAAARKIDVYSTPTCHFCHMEKEFLAAHDIPFTDHDVSADQDKRTYIMNLTGQLGVPVTVITDPAHPDEPDVMVGFSQALFQQKLGLSDDTVMKMAA